MTKKNYPFFQNMRIKDVPNELFWSLYYHKNGKILWLLFNYSEAYYFAEASEPIVFIWNWNDSEKYLLSNKSYFQTRFQ